MAEDDKRTGRSLFEMAQALGIDPRTAWGWARERSYRETRKLKATEEMSAREVLIQTIYLAARARTLMEQPGLPAEAHIALAKLAGLLPLLEDAWAVLE